MLVEDVKSKTDEEINIFFKNEKLNLLQNLKILHNDISSISDLNKLFRQDLDLVNKKHELKIYSAADSYKLTHKILKDVKSKTIVTVCELRMLDLLKAKSAYLSMILKTILEMIEIQKTTVILKNK